MLKVKISLLIVCFLVSWTALAQVDKPLCTVREILEANRDVFPNGVAAIAIPGGGGLVNPYYEPPSSPRTVISTSDPVRLRARLLESIPGRSPEEVKIIAQRIKSFMITQISEGKSKAELTTEQELMIHRLELVTLSVEDCSHAEAFFTHAGYHIKLCMNAAKTPLWALYMTIAHELAHPLDICNLESKLYKKVSEPGLGANDFGDIAATGVTYFLDTPVRNDPRLTSLLQVACTQNRLKLLDGGIGRERNPVSRIVQCLSSANSTYRPIPTGSGYEVCRGSDFTETGAQSWAAGMVNAYLKANPPASRLELLGLFANSLPAFKTDKPSGKELDMNMLVLTDPGVQRLFDCRPPPIPHCADEFGK